MRPAPPSRTPSEATSSLEDSTYDLVSNRDLSESDILSDDDARTESLASYDDNTPDDGSVVQVDGESDEEDNAHVLYTPFDSIMPSIDQTLGGPSIMEESTLEVTPAIGDSTFSAHTLRPEQSFSYINFDVNDTQPMTQEEDLQLIHTVQDVNRLNCKTELHVYNAGYVGLDMLMGISRHPLVHKGNFRVLMISANEHFSLEIAEHLDYALGVEGDSKIERPRITLDHCRQAYFANDSRTIVLDINGSSTISMRGCQAFEGQLPHPAWDLAIFLHPSLAHISPVNVDDLESTFERARLGLTAAKVPIIDLSMHHPLFGAVPHHYYCNRQNLHLRVTTKEQSSSTEVVRELLPVDVDQFLSIDPLTLNRHLSLLTRCEATASTLRRKPVRLWSWRGSLGQGFALPSNFPTLVNDQSKKLISKLSEAVTFRDVVTALGVLLVSIAVSVAFLGGSMTAQDTPGVLTASSGTCVTPSTHSQAGIMQQLSGLTLAVPPSSTATSVISKIVAPQKAVWQAQQDVKQAVSIAADDKRKKEADMVVEAWKEYSLKVIGPGSLILAAPAHLIKFMHPNPVFAMTENGKPVVINVKNLSKGVWTIELPADAGEGDAVLSLRAEYHLPQLGYYPFEYRFSIHQDKSFSAKMKDLVAQEFVMVQNNAMELSTRMTTGLQQYFGGIQHQTLKKVNDTKKALSELSSGGDVTTCQSRTQKRLCRLKKTKKVLRRRGEDIASEIRTSLHAAQEAVVQRAWQTFETIGSISQWRENTRWPVKPADWKPHTAARRGLGNAQGLLRMLKSGQTTINAPAGERTDQCKRTHKCGKYKQCCTRTN